MKTFLIITSYVVLLSSIPAWFAFRIIVLGH